MHKKLIAWALTLLVALPAAQAADEFLQPDQAFVISAQSSDGKTVRFNWDIADGYYLYQSKFRFLSDTPDVEFGNVVLPDGVTKNDPISRCSPATIWRSIWSCTAAIICSV